MKTKEELIQLITKRKSGSLKFIILPKLAIYTEKGSEFEVVSLSREEEEALIATTKSITQIQPVQPRVYQSQDSESRSSSANGSRDPGRCSIC